MKGITIDQFKSTVPGAPEGSFSLFRGEPFYQIKNYDAMPPFFMTIVSSSDVWNYLWSNGGITAGRMNSDHSVFPYYTDDKVSDNRHNTGSYTAIRVYQDNQVYLWEPFVESANGLWKIQRNLYKNTNGSKVFFEEENLDLSLTFQYGWSSSSKYGLVKEAHIIDNGPKTRKIDVLDGCRNILPACVPADFQNDNSVLLDAYKKTDIIEKSSLAIFSLSSIVTDKAEPNEGLYANVGWFSSATPIYLSPSCPDFFKTGKPLPGTRVLKGKRPALFTQISLEAGRNNREAQWYQVFDTSLEHRRLLALDKALLDRQNVVKNLEQDIEDGCQLLDNYIAAADGEQDTADTAVCVHHKANVMFNIMRGGIFEHNGDIPVADFLAFAQERNHAIAKKLSERFSDTGGLLPFKEMEAIILRTGDVQAERIFREYLPLTFSRRHGDPSRPWNRFSIEIRNSDGTKKLNYQGNWRDIFQNWEALTLSYPRYIKNMISKFLNAMTADGFNPYRITREGIDWEIQEPDNPWSNIGYWGDHQVIYLTKLLEIQYHFEKDSLLQNLDRPCHSTANIPYRIKSYADIEKNPRSTIVFDIDLHKKIMENATKKGSDAKLLETSQGNVALVSMTTKLLTILSAKMANYVPGGGIWLNTQRPEWNDANNALAGYGLSMVTLYYIRRTLVFLLKLYQETSIATFAVPEETARFFLDLAELYKTNNPPSLTNPTARKDFVEKAGLLFQKQRENVYKTGNSEKKLEIDSAALIAGLEAFLTHVEAGVKGNIREDNLYHSYNTLEISSDGMKVHRLTEMLEGQVAVLSSGMLSSQEVLDLFESLKKGRLFRKDQYSYILYPEKELPHFCEKNTLFAAEAQKIPLLAQMLEKKDTRIVQLDIDGLCHFNPDFTNARAIDNTLEKLRKDPSIGQDLTEETAQAIHDLYEKTFDHRSFTGRSGTFYAYEGLGSIYWHMISKLLLAVQEYCQRETNPAMRKKLTDCYYDVRLGIGFNKTPQEYGAFPTDPYSHTPAEQGAKQPGMTGQVKEEILTRWVELGININNGILTLNCPFLNPAEFKEDGTLTFTWCGTPFTYRLAGPDEEEQIEITMNGTQKVREGTTLTAAESSALFSRDGTITAINATVHPGAALSGK